MDTSEGSLKLLRNERKDKYIIIINDSINFENSEINVGHNWFRIRLLVSDCVIKASGALNVFSAKHKSDVSGQRQ